MKHGDFPWQNVSSPEGNFWSPWYPHVDAPPRSGGPQTAAPWNGMPKTSKMGDDGRTSWRPKLGATHISWLTALVGENHGKTKGFEGSPISGRTVCHTQSGHLTVATFGSVETYRNIKMSAMEHPHQYHCSHIWSHSLFGNWWSISDLWRKTGDISALVTLAHGFHMFSSNEHDELASAGGTQNYHHSKINQL